MNSTEKKITMNYMKKNKNEIKSGKDMKQANKKLEKDLMEKYNLTQEKAQETTKKVNGWATTIIGTNNNNK